MREGTHVEAYQGSCAGRGCTGGWLRGLPAPSGYCLDAHTDRSVSQDPD